MRVDLLLKTLRIFKRRTIASEAAREGFVFINGKVVKPSYEPKAGDILELKSDIYHSKYLILKIPENKNIKDIDSYIKKL
ncbi:MAG: S4 domain-containing protein [Deferribacterota bacterium]|nr:S4 domain-containing protein [Deferribacterota bacterium]